jgi:hypothetical protein
VSTPAGGIAGFVEVRPISLLLAKSVSTEKKIPPVIGSGRYWSFTSCRNHLTASHAAMAARNPLARLTVPADYKANVAMGLVCSIPSHTPRSSRHHRRERECRRRGYFDALAIGRGTESCGVRGLRQGLWKPDRAFASAVDRVVQRDLSPEIARRHRTALCRGQHRSSIDVW